MSLPIPCRSPRLRLALGLVLFAGCSGDKTKPTGPSEPVSSSTTLAVVGKHAIEAEELANQLSEHAPDLRSRYRESPQLIKPILERRIQDELVLNVARERGYDRDPRIQQLLRDSLVRMVRNDIDQSVTLDQVTPEEVQAYYEQHPRRFSSPLMLRARHLVLRTEPEAQQALALLRKGKLTEERFARLVRERSVAPDAKQGGDLGAMTQPAPGLHRPLFSALATASKPGMLVGPVRTPQGFEVALLTGREEPVLRPLKDVELQARIAVLREKRAQTFNRFLRESEARFPVQRFPDRLPQVAKQVKP